MKNIISRYQNISLFFVHILLLSILSYCASGQSKVELNELDVTVMAAAQTGDLQLMKTMAAAGGNI